MSLPKKKFNNFDKKLSIGKKKKVTRRKRQLLVKRRLLQQKMKRHHLIIRRIRSLRVVRLAILHQS